MSDPPPFNANSVDSNENGLEERDATPSFPGSPKPGTSASSGVRSESQKADDRIHVYVRVRPLIFREGNAQKVVYTQSENEVAVESEQHRAELQVDRVFHPDMTQEQVYDSLRNCVEHAAEGYNSTVFAYGQTSSGKTYTLFGSEGDADVFSSSQNVSANAGIIPRAIRELFAHLQRRQEYENSQENHGVQYTVFCSFLQIYNERLLDLLTDSKPINTPKDLANVPKLTIHESGYDGVYVEGLSEYLVTNAKDCLAIVAQGSKNRAIRSTYMNEFSSRSHTILQLQIERQVSGTASLTRSKLNLVDLAGSERWTSDRSVNLDDSHVSELTNINLSLHTLSRCIESLAKSSKSAGGKRAPRHLPYRESKLTYLLKDSLGGNARTRIVVTVSPAESNVQETLNSLMFADSAKKVMTHAKLNAAVIPDRVLVKKLQAEIGRLRKKLLQYQEQGLQPQKAVETSHSERPPVHQEQAEKRATKEDGSVARHMLKLEQQYAKLLKENQELKEQQRLNPISKQNNGGTNEKTAQPSRAEANVRKLLGKLENSLNKFFNLDIEEDDLQKQTSEFVGRMKDVFGEDTGETTEHEVSALSMNRVMSFSYGPALTPTLKICSPDQCLFDIQPSHQRDHSGIPDTRETTPTRLNRTVEEICNIDSKKHHIEHVNTTFEHRGQDTTAPVMCSYGSSKPVDSTCKASAEEPPNLDEKYQVTWRQATSASTRTSASSPDLDPAANDAYVNENLQSYKRCSHLDDYSARNTTPVSRTVSSSQQIETVDTAENGELNSTSDQCWDNDAPNPERRDALSKPENGSRRNINISVPDADSNYSKNSGNIHIRGDYVSHSPISSGRAAVDSSAKFRPDSTIPVRMRVKNGATTFKSPSRKQTSGSDSRKNNLTDDQYEQQKRLQEWLEEKERKKKEEEEAAARAEEEMRKEQERREKARQRRNKRQKALLRKYKEKLEQERAKQAESENNADYSENTSEVSSKKKKKKKIRKRQTSSDKGTRSDPPEETPTAADLLFNDTPEKYADVMADFEEALTLGKELNWGGKQNKNDGELPRIRNDPDHGQGSNWFNISSNAPIRGGSLITDSRIEGTNDVPNYGSQVPTGHHGFTGQPGDNMNMSANKGEQDGRRRRSVSPIVIQRGGSRGGTRDEKVCNEKFGDKTSSLPYLQGKPGDSERCGSSSSRSRSQSTPKHLQIQLQPPGNDFESAASDYYSSDEHY